MANLDRPALWSLLVVCRALKPHAERKLYETFYLRRYLRRKAVVFRAVERIIDNPDLAMRVRRLDLCATWSTTNAMSMKLAPRLRAALQATKQLQTLAFPHDLPSACYTRGLPGVILPRLRHLNMHHVYCSAKGFGQGVPMIHDTVPWMGTHIGPLTHIELRSTCFNSAKEQADSILNTTESQLPIVDAQYFRATGSILASLLSHTVAGIADSKKLAPGGTVHIQPLEVDPAFTTSLLDALERMIGMLVIDMDAVGEASQIYKQNHDSWELASLRRMTISTSPWQENPRADYNVEMLIVTHSNFFKLLRTPALETLEVMSLFPILQGVRLARALCRDLGPGCPSLQAIKVNSITLVRTSADGPWGAGCWPVADPQVWPFDAPPGFEERPRAWDSTSCEERRSVKAAGDLIDFNYYTHDYEHLKSYAAGDESYARPDNPMWDTDPEMSEQDDEAE
ncbi:hypothetical protein AURDEDRAFT_173996 [Auricularia subglabra TFB-10046 SS5]|uniref:Uncharacterized protein n=1 Tax=Auricularia subglabra (strain TFB-10046 / SS5) TaxID=717982 RepID=J0CZ77_AURST|nr:hypothetical protein AURDEDRAFT_173996 [Auricularia subglabra TFB-10046 SS5]